MSRNLFNDSKPLSYSILGFTDYPCHYNQNDRVILFSITHCGFSREVSFKSVNEIRKTLCTRMSEGLQFEIDGRHAGFGTECLLSQHVRYNRRGRITVSEGPIHVSKPNPKNSFVRNARCMSLAESKVVTTVAKRIPVPSIRGDWMRVRNWQWL